MRRRIVASLIAAATLTPFDTLRAGEPTAWDTALPGINPDMLSGGVYASLSEMLGKVPRTERATLFPGATAQPVVLDPRIGANVPVGADPAQLPADGRQQAEPHVVRSAVDPDYLVATFQEGRFGTVGGARSNGYGVSRDGGLTWTRALIPALTIVNNGPYFRATDPVAGFDRAGNIYLNSLVAVDSTFSLGAVVVSKSTDSGETFATPVTVYQPPNTLTFPDKNWMAVNDFPGTFSTGRLLVTWTNFTRNSSGQSTGNNLVARSSDNGGVTWGALANVTAVGTSKQGSQPMFFSDGTAGMAYITFLDQNDVRQIRIQYQHSSDGGHTWPGPERTVANITGWDDPVLRDGLFLISATSARSSGRIVIAATMDTGSGPRIATFTSTDRGVSWSGPVIASDNPGSISVCNPAVAISDDGMTVSIIYYEKASAPDSLNYVNIRAVHSFNGGTTWTAATTVTDVVTDVRLGQATDRGYMLGDYQGLTMPAGPDAPPVALWIDTRTGNADPFSARVVPAETADYAAWRRAMMSTAQNADAAVYAIGADPDEDGLPNGIEYPLATDPLVADLATPFGYTRAIGPAGMELVLSHPLRNGTSDVQLDWDRSTDGTNWTPTVPRTENSQPILGNSATLVTSTHPLAGETASRFRLRAIVGGTPAPAARSFVRSSDTRLINVSTRGLTGPGDQILTGGFVLEGATPKEVLVRAAGPALSDFLTEEPISNPQIEIVPLGGAAPIASNDDWETPNGPAIAAAALETGAFDFAAGSKDSALLITPGNAGYTAQVKDVGGDSAIALVEVYDASQEITGGRLINLSTRGQVGTGEGILIAGFVIQGTEPKLVLVRAVGPTLAEYNVNGSLADPRLVLFRAGENVPIATIDDWGHARNPRIASDAALLAGAFTLPDGSKDASFLLHLPPGGYTAHVTGVGGATGVALVEVYEVN
ncbi:MAG TPA: sialidase family protein [Opitutaceae bacterium]|nr:sialidase family protein [Opitutaceae bacterium]